jgi:hypothetical protein
MKGDSSSKLNSFNRSKYLLLTLLSVLHFCPCQAQCTANGNQNGSYGQGGDTNSNASQQNYKQWQVQVIRSGDPNEIIGPIGYEIKKWVSINDRMGYTIRFENDPKIATAPAQNVFIRLPVDAKININTLQLADLGFGNFRFSIPPGNSYFAERLDLRDSLGLFVDLTAGIDIVNKEIFWRFRSIDPATGLPPTEALSGFLPVNDTLTNDNDSIPGKGEGFVNFTIKPISTAQTGDTAFAKATIIFDIEEPILTNSWTNTIDAVAPISKINGAAVFIDTVTLHWSGKDEYKGSGVKNYALYYAENGGAFTLYRQNIADTIIQFVGTPGKSYCFFTIATDTTGNKENFKNACEGTVVLPIAGVALPITWLYFNGKESGKDAKLQWATTSEINSKFFAIERSYNGIDFTQIGTVKAAGNSSLSNNYTYLDKDAMTLPYTVLYYRLRQVDNDGRFTYSIIISIKVRHNADEPLITAYPNPFSQHITLRIMTVTATDQTENVSLYSVDGRILYQKRVVNRGNATILLEDIPKLKPGIYLLRVSLNSKMYTIRMIHE